MKLFTQKQKEWFFIKKIEKGNIYMFPMFGFRVYSKPSFSESAFLDTNPFTKSLSNESFYVKEVENGFCKGNFYNKPKTSDFYLRESDLATRNFIEVFLIFIFCAFPLIIYNVITGQFKGNRSN
jgi:hypothetical protein